MPSRLGSTGPAWGLGQQPVEKEWYTNAASAGVPLALTLSRL